MYRNSVLLLLLLAHSLSTGCFRSAPKIEPPPKPDVPRISDERPLEELSNQDLIQNLGHEDPRRQRAAELALTSQRPNDIVPELIDSLEDKNWHVRAGVIRTLGLFGTDAAAALPRLEHIAETDEEEAVRDAAKFNIPVVADEE